MSLWLGKGPICQAVLKGTYQKGTSQAVNIAISLQNVPLECNKREPQPYQQGEGIAQVLAVLAAHAKLWLKAPAGI